MIIKVIKYAGTNGVAFVADFTLLLILDYLLNFDRAYIAGFCYLIGTCVSFVLAKNFVFAHFWWSLARDRNAPGASENLGVLLSKMNQEQKRQAFMLQKKCKRLTLRQCLNSGL